MSAPSFRMQQQLLWMTPSFAAFSRSPVIHGTGTSTWPPSG